MPRFELAPFFGTPPVTRDDGERLRRVIEENWDGDEPIILDFTNLRIASVSFFDEGFGPLARNQPLDEIKKRIRVEHISSGDRALLNNILATRASESPLEEFFSVEVYDHPRLRFWRSLAANPNAQAPTVELHRTFDGLSYGPADLYITFMDDKGVAIRQDKEPWDPQLDLALMNEGWRAPDRQIEAARVALLLKSLFSTAERKFGDGYFSSVVVRVVRGSGFNRNVAIRELLHVIHHKGAKEESQSFHDCSDTIRDSIATAAKVLSTKLKYDRQASEEILVQAMANYLDERFSISAGRKLGLYKTG